MLLTRSVVVVVVVVVVIVARSKSTEAAGLVVVGAEAPKSAAEGHFERVRRNARVRFPG